MLAVAGPVCFAALVDIDAALAFARPIGRGVLATIKFDGRPQMSNVLFVVGDDDVVRVSITETRAKTVNLRRDPRAALHVTAEDFWSYVVLDSQADLTEAAQDPDDVVVDELVGLYRSMRGEHSDWAAYREAMVTDQRLVARLYVKHAYGMLPST